MKEKLLVFKENCTGFGQTNRNQTTEWLGYRGFTALMPQTLKGIEDKL